MGKKSVFVPCFLPHSNHGDVAAVNAVTLAWVSEVVSTVGAQISSQALPLLHPLNKDFYGNRPMMGSDNRDGHKDQIANEIVPLHVGNL